MSSTCSHIYVCIHIPRNRIAESLDMSMLTLLAVFQSACTYFQNSYWHCMRVCIVQPFCQHFIIFLNFSYPSGCIVRSQCGLICISLMTNKVRHLSYAYCTCWTFSRSICWSLLLTFSTRLAAFSALI